MTLDLQKWNVNLVQTSTYSTHANRLGVFAFDITFKDKCWDTTLVAPIATGAPFTFNLWTTHTIPFSYMTVSFGGTNLGNYCNGWEYELERVTGPTAPYQTPSGPSFDALFSQTDFTTGYTVYQASTGATTGLQY
jgi:hypothetical protein